VRDQLQAIITVLFADQSGDLYGDVRAGGRRTVAGRPLSKGRHLKMTKLKEEFFKILPPTI
jgi:hypothetical protein